ncbi:MAG: helix-turn-helix transcriptional regulator [Pseudomonadaceae bacterium]|nr:helix-turn-helix transcriptional regulator [Pseudomonadaceae bacterium]
MTKKPLPPERKIENDKLKALYDAKKKELGLTHYALADALDISQSGVSHYLNGINPLNTSSAAILARLLKVDVSEFSPRLAAEIRSITLAVEAAPPGSNMAALQRLKGKATPRSLEVINRIEKAAQQGRLKEADLVLLEGIAARFEELNSDQP